MSKAARRTVLAIGIVILMFLSTWAIFGNSSAQTFLLRAAFSIGMISFPVYFPIITTRTTFDSKAPDGCIVAMGWLSLISLVVGTFIALSGGQAE